MADVCTLSHPILGLNFNITLWCRPCKSGKALGITLLRRRQALCAEPVYWGLTGLIQFILCWRSPRKSVGESLIKPPPSICLARATGVKFPLRLPLINLCTLNGVVPWFGDFPQFYNVNLFDIFFYFFIFYFLNYIWFFFFSSEIFKNCLFWHLKLIFEP